MSAPEFIPNPVNVLMRDALEGKISRRDMLARGAAMGLSATLLGGMAERVAAADASPAASPAAADKKSVGYSFVKPDWLNMDYKDVTLNIVLGADGTGSPWDQFICDTFAKATGATVNYVKGAESATDRLTYYTQVLNSGSADIDVAQVDVIWPGILAQHAEDLKDKADELKETGATFFDRILKNNTVDDTMVSLPWFTDAGLLYYRTDLLEKYGYSKAPETWAELEEMAKKIVDGEKANASFTGFTFQGKAYEGLTCNALEWVASNGGGTFIDDDGKVTINNDEAKAGIERAKGWIGTISPEAVTGYMEEDSRNVWQGGNAAFHRNWPYAYALGQADDSVIKDKFAITIIPKGDGEKAQNAATLGGWNSFVSKYSKNKDAAKDFAKFMVCKEVQKMRAVERSSNPTIMELYDDKDVIAANPFMKDLFDTFNGGAIPRPSNAAKDLYNDVSIAIHTRVNEILTGQADAKKGIEDLAGQLEDIMKDA